MQGDGRPPSTFALLTDSSKTKESDRFVTMSLMKDAMLIQCYMGLGLEEAHTTVRGETDANFPTETSVPPSSGDSVGTE